MPEIYADWRSLEPLQEPVPVGTKCVVIGIDIIDKFGLGEIVSVLGTSLSSVIMCINADGISNFMYFYQLALLPADYQAEPKAEPKAERKVVQIAIITNEIVAVCDDGTLWSFRGNPETWRKLPPIPQD